MASPAGGKPVELGLIARTTGRLARLFRGDKDDPFHPGEPPEIEDQHPARGFDYEPRYNVSITPKRDSSLSTFSHLRALADGYDLLRLAIETRKDQMCRLQWGIRDRTTKSAEGAEIEAIRLSLRRPDGEVAWSTWIRMLLEEMFVIDAVTLYPRKTVSGELLGIEILDGATIKRVIDERGRTPKPPDVAYQQVIKGIPYADFRVDQLLYMPRNQRINKVYGFSHVEQIVMTVNTGLRRQLHQLSYYTEGNIPEAFMGVPAEWTPDQIRSFQDYWDGLMTGDSGKKRHMKFLPGEIARNFVQVRENVMKDEYDEWLARIVSYTFSLPPTALIRQMNRATAETSNISALEEGIEPTKVYVKDCLDWILEVVYKRPDLEFVFRYESSLDRHKQAQIHQTYVAAGIISPNEAREEIGMQAREGGDEFAAEQSPDDEPGKIRSNASDPANSTN